MRLGLCLCLVFAVAGCTTPDAKIRANAFVRALVSAPAYSQPTGQTVYSASQCIGAIVNGVCHGTIMPDAQYHQTCHGEMINGQCTGPMF